MPVTCLPQDALLPLRLNSVCYEVDEVRLLDNIDITVDSPGITAIMGPNGAGKSLFLRLIHGLLEPSSGEVQWRGQCLDPAMRRRQAMVFQKPVLMRRSVAANIDFVLKTRGGQYRNRRDLILQQAGLFRQRSQPARLLSGGEQQRLALARALATDPDLLLLDEPCASIDSANTLHIENLLHESVDRGVKILLVTHDIGQSRRLADDVIFMHAGRILEHRPANEFFCTPSSTQAQAFLAGKLVF